MHTGYAYSVSVSVRCGLLALLERADMHGYQLRTAFEQTVGETWPLNIGQVYTTLSRLERDGLVEVVDRAGEPGRIVYRLTEGGRAELDRWFRTPIVPTDRPRDELAVKIALALHTPGVNVAAVLEAQRAATLANLRELTRRKASAEQAGDDAWLIVHDLMIFRAEAELRWLDHSDARVAARKARGH